MKNQWKNYLGIGIAAFLTFAACALLFFALYKINVILTVLGDIIGILEPILIGIVIAYLLNPVMNFFEKRSLILLSKTKLKEEKRKTLARGISVGLAILFGVAVVVAVFCLMIPQLISSLYGIAREMPGYLNELNRWVMNLTKNYPTVEKAAMEAVDALTEKLTSWFTSDLIVYVSRYLGYVTSGVIYALNTVLNIVIGLIVAIYVLFSREVFAGQTKKLLYALLKPERANIVLDVARKSNQIFGGFISGKLLDSAIIGILCFICLSVMDMPYTLLVSVIVGVTNIIPFFGPYIGAIPSALIILLVNPIQSLYFIIFILILQQIDGNIIGPAIIGESTGLSAFWVVFAIMLGGGLFGVFGLIMGVPTFAVIYYIVKSFLEHVLKKRGYPIQSEEYVQLKQIDKKSQELIFFEEEEIKNRPRMLKLFQKMKQSKEEQKEEEDDK